MTVVVDTSVVVAALTDPGPDGDWSLSLIQSDTLAAPHVMPIEVARVLRRMTQQGQIEASLVDVAHRRLLNLPVVLFPYSRIGERVWELGATVTVQDACFIALAEGLSSDMATLDRRLTRAPGPRCRFLTPPSV